jgi:hypothetical protein
MNNSLLDLGALPSELTASGFTKSPKRLALGDPIDIMMRRCAVSWMNLSLSLLAKKVDLITE